MDKRNFLFMICVTLAFFGVHTYFGDQAPQKTQVPVANVAGTEQKTIAQNTPDLSSDNPQETFYVLENEYQQLVFSTRGGSLAEINLPLASSDHPESIVKEIDIDRFILNNSPQNSRFPLRPYYTADNAFHEQGKLGGYYPLLRRSILNPNGTIRSAVAPEYYATQLLPDDPTFRVPNYTMVKIDETSIQFQGTVNSRRITKTYSIPKEKKGPYCFNLDLQIEGEGSKLYLSSGVPDAEIVAGTYSPLLRYQFTTKNGESDVETIDLPKNTPIQNDSLVLNWISNCNGFLGQIIDPLIPIPSGFQARIVEGTQIPTRLTLVDPGYNLYPAASYPGYLVYLPISAGTTPLRVFAGPFDSSLLDQLDTIYSDPATQYNPQYKLAQKIQGWFSFISEPFSKFLSFLIQIFYRITHSWALSIVLLTVAMRVMMYPLNNWSIRSMAKLQELQPKIQALQNKYKNDPKRSQLELANLYRESGANPLGGCLPMLLQLPFFSGMYYLLKSSFPLRGAVFFPGWIDDLAAPDVLFTWGQPLWMIGNEFHLLPILLAVTMYLQQRMSMKPPKDPNNLTDAEQQQKMMGLIMPIVLTVMFYNMPSGFNIYFMFSTLLGIAQQVWVTRQIKGNNGKL
jgi:YidC/Oxa1 family membrane protein insertase